MWRSSWSKTQMKCVRNINNFCLIGNICKSLNNSLAICMVQNIKIQSLKTNVVQTFHQFMHNEKKSFKNQTCTWSVHWLNDSQNMKFKEKSFWPLYNHTYSFHIKMLIIYSSTTMINLYRIVNILERCIFKNVGLH